MPRTTDIRIVSAEGSATRVAYRAPIKFGGRVVTDALLWDVVVDVETAGGMRARGWGSMPLGNVWAWPSNELSASETLAALSDLAERTVKSARTLKAFGHPLELTTLLAGEHAALATETESARSLPERIPALAQAVAASPLEAALHDAYGRLHGQNTYNLLGPEWVGPDLAHWLTADFRGEYLDQYTLREPKRRMPLYHLVGALDPLTPAEVVRPIADGLPETLVEWIAADGLTHLKIKLAGDQLGWDVARVVDVEQATAAAQHGRDVPNWHYSLDFNERCPHVEYVLDFLAQLAERSPAAFGRVQYLEQPTQRDLRAAPENRMHRASQIKPVVIDESLIGLESLLAARELGYTGVALKACKGQTQALLMGAAAQKYGLFLCVQDLTCPGRSFLQSASLAARVPTVAAIEGNGRQYCPAGNAGWAERFPGMFQVRGGTIETGLLCGVGLGF